MEDYRRLWAECLSMIRERINNQERYAAWWRDIEFYGFDEQQNALTVQLPSRLVSYYIEEHHVPLMQEVLNTVFKRNVRLRYKLPPSQPVAPAPDFSQMFEQMKQRGFNVGGPIPQVSVPDAAQRMRQSLREIVGDQYRWVPAYDKVASWLTDNHCKWLLCIGFSGTGKSRLCREVLPLLIGFGNVAQCSAIEMTEHNGKTARIDELLKASVIVVDGLGTEDASVSHYGRHRRPFYELCDAAERQGKLLILTTNCLTPKAMPDDWPWKHQFPTTFGERYGEDVLSRLRSHTFNVTFDEILR